MLLIKDLSARLPYAVTVEHTSGFRGTLHDITVHHMYDDNDDVHDAVCYTDFFGDEDSIYIEYFKPYLFPLSSMTEEQEKEEYEICKEYIIGYESNLIDFYNKYHLDYRGLIPKGLAIDATGKNIY
jgi:hypothetical protein